MIRLDIIFRYYTDLMTLYYCIRYLQIPKKNGIVYIKVHYVRGSNKARQIANL